MTADQVIAMVACLGGSGFIAWVARATVFNRMEALEKRVTVVDDKHSTSNKEQGIRIGDLESWNVAHEAVEKERQRVREDTRGIPVSNEGKRSRDR